MRTSETTRLEAWGITLLRLVAGMVFLGAGVQNLSVEGFGELPEPIAGPMVMVGSLGEILCGAALVVGLLTRWASLALALLMLADILAIHPPSSFFTGDEGFEHALLRLGAGAALALAGPGKAALDNVLAIRRGAQ